MSAPRDLPFNCLVYCHHDILIALEYFLHILTDDAFSIPRAIQLVFFVLSQIRRPIIITFLLSSSSSVSLPSITPRYYITGMMMRLLSLLWLCQVTVAFVPRPFLAARSTSTRQSALVEEPPTATAGATATTNIRYVHTAECAVCCIERFLCRESTALVYCMDHIIADFDLDSSHPYCILRSSLFNLFLLQTHTATWQSLRTSITARPRWSMP
jgi:hypothetical protein